MGYCVIPCPACGQEAILHHTVHHYWTATCPHCDLTGAGNTPDAALDGLARQAAERDTKRLAKS